MNTRLCVVTGGALFFLSTLSAHATLVAYESFDYSGNVLGSGSGAGWSDNWASPTGAWSTAAGLTYANAGGSVPATGNSATHTAGNQAFRTLATGVAEPAAGQSVWLGFLANQTVGNYTNVATFRAGTELLSFGQTYTGTGLSPNYSMWGLGVYSDSGVPADTSGTTNLFVMQLLGNADGSTSAFLYRNPTLGVTPNTTSAIASRVVPAATDLTFDRIRLENGAASGIRQDEVRVGTTFADVTSSPVPEPASAFVLAAGVGLLAGRRRRV